MRFIQLLLCVFSGFFATYPTDIKAQVPIKNILLDDDVTGYAPCEPAIAISFTNPDIIVAGAILNKIYYTSDGGKNWTKQTLTSSYGVFGDPVLVSGYDGSFYYFHLSDPENNRWQSERLLDRIVCQKSTDGGKTWNNGGFMGSHHPKDQDKEWAVVNPRNNQVLSTWTQFDRYDSKDPLDRSNILFSFSKNGGKSWKKAVQINEYDGDCLDDDGTTEGAVPTVGPEGEIYVVWSLNDQIWFDRSFDNGKTWLEKDIIAADQPGGWAFDIPGISRCNGMPILTCDLSNGPNRGTLYLNWSDQRNGDHDTDIWFAKSVDKGETWSKPQKVNDDRPGKQQFFTWMSLDPTTGYLYIVFYDRRNYEDFQTDVYLAYSTDGGKTFTNRKISEKPFVPTEKSFFGDYNHISAYSGRICPIWTRMDDGKTSVWTAVINQGELIGK
ncbi:MAG: sialidase family protein [Bacteroidia bacterium]|nr:sialidase family protein [Bacteroidia bacterium]